MSEPTHRAFGYSIDESVKKVSNELEYDAVGLWQIIPKGRIEFGLTEKALDDFTARHIVALIGNGAVPVRGKAGTNGWEIQHQYGTNPEEVAQKIISEWKASGVDPDVSGIWFLRA